MLTEILYHYVNIICFAEFNPMDRGLILEDNGLLEPAYKVMSFLKALGFYR